MSNSLNAVCDALQTACLVAFCLIVVGHLVVRCFGSERGGDQ